MNLNSPSTHSGDGKTLDQVPISSRIEFGTHTWPQAEVSIVWAVQSWQDERCGRPANERVGRDPAGREEVTEAEVALARLDR